MTNNLSTFSYLDNDVRVVEIDGQTWFVAADVCSILFNPRDVRVNGASKYTQHLAGDEKRVLKRRELVSLGLIVGASSTPSMSILAESGLYKLVMRSDKQAARKFQDWVTREVLPAIRKDGGYILGEEKVRTGELSEDELILKAMQLMTKKIDRLVAEKEVLLVENKRMNDELTIVTLDEWRALRHLYLDKSDKGRIATDAFKLARLRGIKLGKQTRIMSKGKRWEREVTINLYPDALLDEVARELGFLQ